MSRKPQADEADRKDRIAAANEADSYRGRLGTALTSELAWQLRDLPLGRYNQLPGILPSCRQVYRYWHARVCRVRVERYKATSSSLIIPSWRYSVGFTIDGAKN
jgi:hypothetical protein